MKSSRIVLFFVLWLMLATEATAQDIFKYHLGMSKTEAIQVLKTQHVKFEIKEEAIIARTFKIRDIPGGLMLALKHDKIDRIGWAGGLASTEAKVEAGMDDYYYIANDFTKHFEETIEERFDVTTGNAHTAWVSSPDIISTLFYYLEQKSLIATIAHKPKNY